MPTTNPVPSQDPSDLLFNAGKLDEVVSGSNATYTDRLGVSRRTMAGVDAAADLVLGGLGYAPPVAYAAGIALTLTTQTVEYAGEVYAPKGSVLPFTTSGTFETEKFRLIQGVASADLVSGGGAAMVGYTPAGTGAVATTVQDKNRKIVHVTDFAGVDPTGATSSLAGLQAAADYCKTSRYKLEGVPGAYLLTGTWVIECDADLSTMNVQANATTVSTAVRVGPNTSGQYLFDADIKLPFVINTTKTGAGWAGFENSIGVEIANAYQCRITVPSVYNFGVGLKEGGYGAGCVYNTITIGILYGNKINHQIKPGSATGWANQNTHIGGRFAYSSIEGTAVSGVVQIQCRTFDTATNNPPNTNAWMNPSVEGNEPAFHLDIQGRYNTIISPRLETFAPTLPKVNWHSDSVLQNTGNTIVGGYINSDVTYSYSGAGTIGNNQLISNRASGVMDFSGCGYNTRNTTGDTFSDPHFQGFPASVSPFGKDRTATNWTYRISSRGAEFKPTGSAYATARIDGALGYIFFGSGAAAPTAGMRYNPTPLAITSDVHFAPDADNTLTCGTSNRRWSVVYAGTGTINTSDERAKQDVAALSDAERHVAVAIKGLVKKYRFKDAVAAKGDAARIHVGVIAQEVVAAFQAEGLDPIRYGIVCFDEWVEEDGTQHNRYGVRYEELLTFMIAAL